MFKKIICLGLVLLTCAGLLCGCTYAYQEEDFSLELTVSSGTEVSVNDTVVVTATLKNLSGKDIKIHAAAKSFENLEDLLLIGSSAYDILFELGITENTKPYNKFLFRKDAVITQTKKFDVRDNE